MRAFANLLIAAAAVAILLPQQTSAYWYQYQRNSYQYSCGAGKYGIDYPNNGNQSPYQNDQSPVCNVSVCVAPQMPRFSLSF